MLLDLPRIVSNAVRNLEKFCTRSPVLPPRRVFSKCGHLLPGNNVECVAADQTLTVVSVARWRLILFQILVLSKGISNAAVLLVLGTSPYERGDFE